MSTLRESIRLSTPLRLRLVGVGLLGALVACGGAREPSASAPAGAPRQPVAVKAAPSQETAAPVALAADTPMKTRSGATFEAPKSWLFSDRGDLLVLDDPERDLRLSLLEIANEPDAAKAIAAAWKRVQPGFDRKVKESASPPVTSGWDAVVQTVYETGSTEQRTVIAVARRKGDTHYVALIDGANAGLDRRGAQLMTVISSFKAAGLEEESFKGRTAHAFDAERVRLLERFLEDALERAHVPGAAIAVVQGGKVVFEKGFGVRELGKHEPVSPRTLFMIGSTTKSLTTLMMAKLVDERKFAWETPVTQVLPSFALADAAVSGKVQMKHTVCACTGLPRQDMEFLFEYAGVTPEQRVASMHAMRPTTGFGETFQYSNTMVAAGGYAAAHAAMPGKALGTAYDEVMASRVFRPLGMRSTTMDFAVAATREHATPHAETIEAKLLPIPLGYEEGVVSVRPAGAVWSNVEDMSKYVMLELANGRDEKGRSVVSESSLRKRREPQVKITDTMAYGLGLFVETDHGATIVHHGGNNLGFTTDLYVLPEDGVGVVMLTNAGDANAFRRAVRRRVLELLFDGKEEAHTALEFALSRRKEAMGKELARINREPSSEWQNTIVGEYRAEGLGKVVVRLEGKRLVLDAGEWKSAIGAKTETDGTLKVILVDPPLAGLELRPGQKDGKKTLSLELPQQSYVLEAAAAMPAARAK